MRKQGLLQKLHFIPFLQRSYVATHAERTIYIFASSADVFKEILLTTLSYCLTCRMPFSSSPDVLEEIRLQNYVKNLSLNTDLNEILEE